MKTSDRTRAWLVAPLIASTVLVGSVRASFAQSSQEFPTQREWAYAQQPDLHTGDLQPEATLMSRNTLPRPAETKLTNYGYISVRNDPRRPVKVALTIEKRLRGAGAMDCKPSGCMVKVRFGTASLMSFRALPGKDWPEQIVLEDGAAFAKEASRTAGAIDVQFTDLENGAVIYHFASAAPLRMERLTPLRK
ncbi:MULTISPECIES: hypothetical protein [unclassified Acidovorax]|uniref:hypothetical protein n=1 Tax=unclassified Acidovorax TaxID=2684926 RepID=UPI000C51A558|nr:MULTISPECIES: hypothetical protein [unclassified Acidovorax]PIF19987.1 hypothetical protein CLU87_3968 [Acidovorax sp. 59]PKW00989.1 hypothetical protein CLU89_0594 [Acidovorax sp. 30]